MAQRSRAMLSGDERARRRGGGQGRGLSWARRRVVMSCHQARTRPGISCPTEMRERTRCAFDAQISGLDARERLRVGLRSPRKEWQKMYLAWRSAARQLSVARVQGARGERRAAFAADLERNTSAQVRPTLGLMRPVPPTWKKGRFPGPPPPAVHVGIMINALLPPSSGSQQPTSAYRS